MKAFNVLALFSVLVSVTLAVPVPVRDGKQKAVDDDHRLENSLAPYHLTPEQKKEKEKEEDQKRTALRLHEPLSHPPLPGRSGVHTDNGITTAYYGDDVLHEHMNHVELNHNLHPENRNPMGLAHDNDANRNAALRNILTKEGKHRDEKMPAMFHNPNHATTTTVQHLDENESKRERSMLGGTRVAMVNVGIGAKGQVRPNRGWLPLDPSQQRGHEAPAILNSHSFDKEKVKAKELEELRKASEKPKTEKKKIEPAEHHREAYTPILPDGKELRTRPAKTSTSNIAPPHQNRPARKKPTGGKTNLLEISPPEPGHVFKGTSEERPERASHHGAPAPPSNSHERYPPRPQDQAHHEKMQAAAAAAAAQGHGTHHPPAPYAGTVPNLSDPTKLHKYYENLATFNQNHPHTLAIGNAHGHGRSVEAPAIMQTHHTNQPHNHGASTHNPPAQGVHHVETHHTDQPSTSNHGASTSHNPPAQGAHHPAPPAASKKGKK